MAKAFQPLAFDLEAFESAYVTPALFLRLTDGRQLRAALSDARRLASLTDGRQLVPALALAPLLELGQGGVIVVTGRVPMLTASGKPPAYTPRNYTTPWAYGSGTTSTPGSVGLGYAEVLPAEPAHYVPGALRPDAFPAQGTLFTKDTIRVTDSLGTYRDMAAWWHATIPEYAPAAQALEVAIDSDGVAALYSGGELALTATGGTGPYTWDIVTNRSGCTLTVEGAYVAGPAVGIDRVRVTDSLGAVGLAQLEVIPAQLGVDMTGDPETEPTRFNVFGYQCVPYAEIWGEGGTGPYTIAMQDNQTGATIQPAKGVRVALNLTNSAGAQIDLTGWTFEARLYSQRGGVMADGLAVTATGTLLEVELPDPATLPLDPAVLRITATTAGTTYALGYTTTAIEVLLIARPET